MTKLTQQIGRGLWEQCVFPYLDAAEAKLYTDEALTEKEEAAVAIASGCSLKECIYDAGKFHITTEEVGVVKCGDEYRVFVWAGNGGLVHQGADFDD